MQEHPSKQMLERLLAETLPDNDRDTIAAHLETCSECQNILHTLTLDDAGGSSVSLLSLPHSIPQAISVELDTFFQKLKRIPAPGSTPSVGESDGPEDARVPPPQLPGYEILDELGRGTSGVVYRARDLALNRLVAVKLIHAGPRLPAAVRQRFEEEAKTIARLKHPNIVQIYAVGEHAGCPFLSLELIEGGNLADWMNGKPQSVPDCIRIIASLAQAIGYAHDHGVVHRDLKPANVLFSGAAEGTDKREIRVTDFGIAKVLPEQGIAETGMTQTNEILGTPAYMAPEQASGKAKLICPATDVYAIGAILYELLTGRPPFQGANSLDTLMQAMWQDPVPVRLLVPRLPRDLETICLKCLHKDPARRYATATDLADDIRRFEKGEPIVARPTGIAERTTKWTRRHPAIVVSVVAAMLAVTILIRAAFVMLSQRASTVAAVEEDLREVITSQQKSEWQRARDALDRANLRLAGHDYGDLRHRLGLARRDSDLASRFDAIWLDHQKHLADTDAAELASGGYQDAFRNAGVGTLQEPAPAVAARVRNSNIRATVVAALDDWSTCAAEESLRGWVLDVARDSDIDPDGWRSRTRAVWNDGPKLSSVTKVFTGSFGPAERAKLADEPAAFLLALDLRLSHFHVERTKLLSRVQQTHPFDFFVNVRLGDQLMQERHSVEDIQPVEAIGFYEAALAVHPDFPLVRSNLALALQAMGQFDQAIDQYNQAIRFEPKNFLLHGNLGVALGKVGRYDEAIAEFEECIRDNPTRSMSYLNLGYALLLLGRNSEALDTLHQALAKNPDDHERALALANLRLVLTRMGRSAEADSLWRKVLDDYPHESQAWLGYPEYCMYVGRQDDYLWARQSVLRLFADATDPTVCQQMAIACLLAPLPEDQLKTTNALISRALSSELAKDLPHLRWALFAEALAEYRAGHFLTAGSIMTDPLAGAPGPPKIVLAMAEFRLGKVTQARHTLAQAVANYNWGPTDDQERQVFHALRREAEAMMLPNLDSFLHGQYQPRNNDERLAFTGICQFENRSGQLARLWCDAFAADPNLARSHRYDAACAAALAGCGRGIDSASFNDADRTHFRDQARQCLASDLDSCEQQFQHGGTDRQNAEHTLSNWLKSEDMAGVRDANALEKLPAEERKQWTDQWQRASDLARRASVTDTPSKDPQIDP
jgi:serine/threonine-protein kinase